MVRIKSNDCVGEIYGDMTHRRVVHFHIVLLYLTIQWSMDERRHCGRNQGNGIRATALGNPSPPVPSLPAPHSLPKRSRMPPPETNLNPDSNACSWLDNAHNPQIKNDTLVH
jgi:hypothetical protein